MVTVYRALDLLSGLGLVRRLDLGDGPRYELAEDHHHHLICEGCGEITEFDECPLDLRSSRNWGDFEVQPTAWRCTGRAPIAGSEASEGCARERAGAAVGGIGDERHLHVRAGRGGLRGGEPSRAARRRVGGQGSVALRRLCRRDTARASVRGPLPREVWSSPGRPRSPGSSGGSPCCF